MAPIADVSSTEFLAQPIQRVRMTEDGDMSTRSP